MALGGGGVALGGGGAPRGGEEGPHYSPTSMAAERDNLRHLGKFNK